MLDRIKMTPALYAYLIDMSLHEPDVLRRLREETSRMPLANMLIPPEQGQLMNLLIQAIGARKTLELGVFTGYSALWTALALPPDGVLIACDVSKEWTDIAKRYWREAGVSDKIDLRLGPALKTLDGMLRESQAGTFDFIFMDADKENYVAYYERALQLVRPGGLIAIDNVLWSGKVIDPQIREPETLALKDLNERLREDDRVLLSMLPVADGLTLALKRLV
jgi:predicted O-methyltransferase YrrM